MLTPLAALALLLSPPTDARESGLAPPEIGWGPEGAYGRIPLFWAADPGWDLTLSPGWGEAGAEGAGRLRWARGGEGEIEARLSGVDDLGWGGAWSARGQGRLRLGPARLGVDGAGAADPAAWGRGQRGAARLDDRLLMVAGLSLQGAQLGVGLRQHVEHDLRRDERAATPSLYLHLHTDDGGLSAQAEWVTARRPWLRTLIDGRRRLPLGPLTLRLDGGLLSLTDTDATGGRRAWAAGATGLGLAMGRRFGLYWHEWRVEISGAWSDGWRRGEIDWLTPASRGWAGIEAAQTLRGEALRLEISGRWMPWSWRAAEPGWVAGWAEGRARLDYAPPLGRGPLSLQGALSPWRRHAALSLGERRRLTLGWVEYTAQEAWIDDLFLYAAPAPWRGQAVTLATRAPLGGVEIEGGVDFDPVQKKGVAAYAGLGWSWRGATAGRLAASIMASVARAAPDLFVSLRL